MENKTNNYSIVRGMEGENEARKTPNTEHGTDKNTLVGDGKDKPTVDTVLLHGSHDECCWTVGLKSPHQPLNICIPSNV